MVHLGPIAPVPGPGETTAKYLPVEYATVGDLVKVKAPHAYATMQAMRKATPEAPHVPHIGIPSATHTANPHSGSNKALDFECRISSRGPAVPFHPMTHVKTGERPTGWRHPGTGEVHPVARIHDGWTHV
jgi:hypothetical protein